MRKIYLALLTLFLGVGLSAQTYNSGVSMSVASTGPFDVYPNDIVVSGWGNTGPISVTISDISHTWIGDLQLLLVGPTGATSLLFSNSSLGGSDFINNTLTFQTGGTLPLNNVDGTYDVSGTTWSGTAPAPAGPHSADLTVFDGTNADGTWSLYVYDRASGDGGSIVDWSITLSTPPACPAPSGLSASSVTASSADLSWTSTESFFDVAIGVAPFGPPAGPDSTGINATSLSLNGLASGTSYEYYVRADCAAGGGSGQSAWTGPFSFSTTPGCGDNVSGLCYSLTSTQEVLVSFEVTTPGDWATLTFNAGGVETCCDEVVVYDGLNGTGNIIYGSLTGGGLSDYSGEGTVTSTTGQISLVVNSDVSATCNTSGYTPFDVTLDCVPPPACLDPTVLSVANVTSSSADLSWTSTESFFDVAIGVAPFGPPAGPDSTGVNATTLAVTGLASGTTYEYYVRADCAAGGGSGQSNWVGPFSFSTSPACGDNVSGLCYSSTSTQEVLVSFQATPGDWAEIVINAGGTEACCDELVAYDGLNGTGNIIFGALTGGGSSDYSGTVIQSTTGQISLVVNSDISATCNSSGYTPFDVTLNCVTPPACIAPTALAAGNVTVTSADLSWTSTESFFDVAIGVAPFGPPATADSSGVNATTLAVTGLTGATTYEYYVRADCAAGGGTGQSTWTGPFSFTTLVPPPANDDCGGAIALTSCNGGPQSLAGTTLNATVDASYIDCGATGSNTTERGVWYSYVGDDNEVTITTCDASGTGYDTRLTVYSGSCGAFVCEAGNDDMSPSCSNGSFRSEVTFNAFSGTTYYIFVHGYQSGSNLSAVGDFILNWDCSALCLPVPGNEDCANATTYPLTTSYSATTVSNECATDDVAPNPTCFSSFATLPDIWYEFTTPLATTAVNFRVDLNGTATGMGYALYSGACGSLVLEDCNTGVVSGATNTITGLTGGTTYKIAILSSAGERGSFDFGLWYETCPTPTGLGAGSLTATSADLTWTSNAASNNFDIYYGVAPLAVPTGATTPTVDDYDGGAGASVTYALGGLTGTTSYEYYVREDCGGGDVSSWAGPFAFTTPAPPPANDLIANAIPVSCGTVTSGTTVNATTGGADESGTCGTSITAPGVWYSFVGYGDDVTFDLCGAPYDSKISIFTGTPGSLSCVVGEDDDFTNCSGNDPSVDVLSTVPGETYYILVHGFSAGTGSFSLAVTCSAPSPPPGSVLWTGATSTDWNDASNWAGGAPPFGCPDVIFIPNAGNLPSVAANVQVGALILGSSANVDVQSGAELQVCGDILLGSSSSTSGDGTVNLQGSVPSSTVTAITSGAVNNVVVEGNYLLTSGTLEISNSLVLSGGDFANVGGSVVLLSDISGTAYFDDFTNPGNSFVGDMTVQRFISDGFAGGLGQRYIGSAVGSSTVSGLDNTYTVYPTGGYLIPNGCLPNLIDLSSPYSNLMRFDEDATFPTSCPQEGWFALDASTTNLTPGRGYSAWVNNGSVIEVTGTPNTGVQGIAVTNSASNTTVTRGFNVISNPYPSPINVNAVTATGLTSPQYYNASTGAFSGTFQPVIVAGSEIPIMQGFTVFSTTNATLNLDNTARIASNNPNFAQAANWFTYKLDVQVTVDGKSDMTYVSFGENTTAGFDNSTDCVKRPSIVTSPTLYTLNNNERMSLNAYNETDLGQSVPMGLVSPATGTATFSFSGMDDFPANTTIYVEDLELGIFHNVADGDYEFEADASASNNDRFVIHFVTPVSFDIVNPTCDNPTATIVANANDTRTFDVIADGTVIENGSVNGSAITLDAGDYAIEVHDAFGGSQVYNINIEEVTPVTAAIIASASTVEVGDEVSFEFNGTDATSYEWRIDGQVVAQTEMFEFEFNTPGSRTVEVFAANENCEALASFVVEVAEKSTSIVEVGEGTVSIYGLQGNVVFEFNNINQGKVDAAVYNLLGQELAVRSIESSGKQTIESVNWAEGYYLVKLQIGEEVVNETILLTK